MPKPIVEIKNFSLELGGKRIISDLSFTVNRGETFALLGANGSGKTSTIRSLLGIYQPAGGQLLLGGRPFAVDGEVKLGYLPEERGLYKKEKVIDTMIYFARLKGLAKSAARDWSMDFLRQVDLADKAELRLDKLSGGQQQKVQLGITIMADPQLMILDEPTKGFDPVNRRLLMDIIEKRQEMGATVIFVTHQMEEVERLCDRLILLKDGKSVLYGTIDEAKDQFGGTVVEVISAKPVPENLKLYDIKRREGSVTTLAPKADFDKVQQFLLDKHLTLTKIEQKRPSLDDIFVQVYGHSSKKEPANA